LALRAGLMGNKSGTRVDQKGLGGSEAGWWGASLGGVRADRACREWVEGKGGAKPVRIKISPRQAALALLAKPNQGERLRPRRCWPALRLSA